MKSLNPCLLALLAAALGLLPLQLPAQTVTNKATVDKQSTDTKSSTATKPPKEKKESYIPFHGDLASADKSARTITVGKRTFQINSETKLYKGDSKAKSPATLDDFTAGEGVTGTYKKTEDGKLVAHTVYYKPKAAAKASDKKAK